MNKFINKLSKCILSAALACCCLSSCQSIDLGNFDEGTETSTVTNTKTKDVTFVMKGISEEYVTSRSSVTEAGCTDIYIIEGDSLLAHKTSTDADFESPTVSLNYGTHSLTFIASKATGQSFTNKLWTCSKVSDTFATTMDVTVSSTSSKSRQVQLTRRAAKIIFSFTDAVPTNVINAHFKVGNHMSLDKNLAGTDSLLYESTINVSSLHGVSGGTVSTFILPKNLSDQEQCEVMIEFLDKNNNALFRYERTVDTQTNHCTKISGNYFTGANNMIDVITTWDSEITTQLFE